MVRKDKKITKKKKETILVFSSHSDDFVIGAGGTIANYAKEGKKVITIIFSYGEKSHPWMKEKVVQNFRAEEAKEACKILKCKALFYNLRELHFKEDFGKIEEKLIRLIKKEKPSKIFTHSMNDPWPDHQILHQLSLELWEKLPFKPEVYVYSVWNPISLKTQFPALYVDISITFFLKLRALKTFQSQKVHVAYPAFLLLFRTIYEGFKIKKLFAEMFYKVR